MARERVIPVLIEEEMKDSYLDYSMSVIVARALPDVRDGLKPVHRRVLYGMHELGLLPERPYKKSARVVGEVLGKYHPHGDAAVYDTMVRMVQDFSLRYPLIDGQGNFGSIDGDSPAAMRYTEVRLAPIAMELLRDIEKNTVDFVPNFDETLQEPTVLPTILPNLMVNGSSGIAVGMATNIPPHNLGEVIDGLVALIDNPDASIEQLMQYVKGPDFPTGAIIYGTEELSSVYQTGRGKLLLRAKANIETVKGGKEHIVVTEIPYQVNKSNLLEKIAEQVQAKRIEGITDLRDESDRDGLRIVIELKRDAQPEVVLNQLYKHTQMQITFGVIMLALVDGQPRVLNLRQMLQHFIDFRHEVVVRRTKFDLDKAEKRAHILEGLKIALDNIDEIIELIKKSRNPQTAKSNLMRRFKLSEIQAQAILDMRLQRLTGLERKKIEEEYLETIKFIAYLRSVLESHPLRMQLIKDELIALKEKYDDDRRTEIITDVEEFKLEDLIAEEDMVITISHNGFIKRFPVSGYRRQMRGGKGCIGAVTEENDFVEHLFVASTHEYMLFFTNLGRCYGVKVYEIPQAGRASKGRAIVNFLKLSRGESIKAFVKVREFDDQHFLVMATERGLIKKTNLIAFSNPRRNGINAINIREGDNLIEVKLTDGNHELILGTWEGKALRFHESDVRDMGRNAAGVKGITLSPKDKVIGMVTVERGATLLVVTENGFGKRCRMEEYRTIHRGGKGIIAIRTTEQTGHLIAMKGVFDDDDLMIVTTNGQIIRQNVKGIRIMGRNARGVRLIRLNKGDRIADIARVVKEQE
ncbi:DNA gyrase subunit A [candidate division KSB1 bacterium]|nr:MAG: DNA gyrase subunit A [candidate division KSB1 bacterium 4484_219]RKY80818.1 MAG: DNA gyrase subunit A [candidate division KSB1 bacterium]RKY80828.1 MAG: DNA gyrase subunit A [candidate division KSB1 bacterium]RKY86069.1 MAG: DNA gyrase subunit A [candidate division KSB1 bacterium]